MIRFPLPVRRSSLGSAREGDKVRFSLEEGKDGKWKASIITSFGSADSARVCADAIIDAMGIPAAFSEEVQKEAKKG